MTSCPLLIPFITSKLFFNPMTNSGQAVNGTYTKEVNNTCKYQDAAKTMVYWTYNATNPLPKCIRKCFIFWLRKQPYKS